MVLVMHTRILQDRGPSNPATDDELIKRSNNDFCSFRRNGSTGIGSVYTDLFAKRIHDLMLAVRDRARKEWSTNVED